MLPDTISAHSVLDTATARLQAGDTRGALSLLARAVALDPGNTQGVHLLGAAAAALGQAGWGGRLLCRSLRLDPQRTDVLANLIRLAEQMEAGGFADEARRLYGETLVTLGASRRTQLMAIINLVSRSQGPLAVALCRRFLALTPVSPQRAALLDAALLLVDLGIVDPGLSRAAARWAVGVLRADPGNVTALAALGQHLYAERRDRTLARLLGTFFARFPVERVAADRKTQIWSMARFDDAFFASLPSLPDAAARLPALLTLNRPAFDAPAGKAAVLILSDGNYWRRFSARFFQGLAPFHDGHPVHVHLIDPDVGCLRDLARLQAAWPGTVSATWEHTDGALARYGDAEAVKTYYASIRFVRAAQIQSLYRTGVLILDIDTIMRQGLSTIARRPGDDAVVRYGRKMGPTREYLAGAVLFNPTPAGLRYLDLVARYVAAFLLGERPFWMLDQAALYCCAAHLRRAGTPPAIGLYGEDLHAACDFAMGSDDEKSSFMG